MTAEVGPPAACVRRAPRCGFALRGDSFTGRPPPSAGTWVLEQTAHSSGRGDPAGGTGWGPIPHRAGRSGVLGSLELPAVPSWVPSTPYLLGKYLRAQCPCMSLQETCLSVLLVWRETGSHSGAAGAETRRCRGLGRSVSPGSARSPRPSRSVPTPAARRRGGGWGGGARGLFHREERLP